MRERGPLIAGGLLAAAAVGGIAYISASAPPDEPPIAPVDAPPSTCVEATPRAGARPFDTWSEGSQRASVRVSRADGAACTRRYTLRTSAPLRDGLPANPRVYSEALDAPRLRSGNALFDALYALALVETREASVDSIRDDAFDEGRPLACAQGGCFETGRLWTYVWTRDTAYSMDLGLAALDPARARSSLDFKLSEPRGGGDLAIVQDTGSGGSWPVSTDRVVWALGAWETLQYLDGEARVQLRDRAYEAIRTSIEQDRAIAFDGTTGLYWGEQSFLDWREQSYPPWTAEDTVQIASSQALSTNVAHVAALRVLSELASERGEDEGAARYRASAEDLSRAIDRTLWLEDAGMWSAFTTTFLDPAPARRFDLLGVALAVLEDVGDEERARRAIASYPVLPHGPPVVWPQQRSVPVYHNRAVWPFVTAYWVRAAAKVRNDAAVTAGVRSLVRGAALNLSNMENFEALSGAPKVEEGPLSGPVVNSQRQLWSVAGYVSMVHDVLFGMSATREGLRFTPYVTRELRKELFAGTDTLVLDGLAYRGRKLVVVVRLPPPGDGAGAYRAGEVRLNGEVAEGGLLSTALLADSNRVEIELVDAPEEGATIARVERVGDRRAVYGPETPVIEAVERVGGSVRVTFAAGDAAETAAGADGRLPMAYRVFRDGELVGRDLPGGSRHAWLDGDATVGRVPSACYTVEAYWVATGLASQRARPVCVWGARGERRHVFDASQLEVSGAEVARDGERAYVADFGEADDTIAVRAFRATSNGEYLVRLIARNHAGPINTGVTCGVKRVEVREAASDTVVAAGFVAMPHTPRDAERAFLESTPLRAELRAGRAYRIVVVGDAPSAINMSSLAHFERYTGGRGGRDGAYNRVDVAAIEVLAR